MAPPRMGAVKSLEYRAAVRPGWPRFDTRGYRCTHLFAVVDAQKLEARAFAVEISRIVKKVTGLEVVLNVEQFGAANGIYWVIRGIESLDEFQKQIAVLLADPEYLAKVNEGVAGEYFVPGSLEDLLLQSVDV